MESYNQEELKNLREIVKGFNLDDLKCPVTGNKAVAVCIDSKSPQVALCTNCLIFNLDLVKKFRASLVPIEDLKEKIILGSERQELADEKKLLLTLAENYRIKLKKEVTDFIGSQVDKGLEDYLNPFLESVATFQYDEQNAGDQVAENEEKKAKRLTTEEFKSALTQKGEDVAEILKRIYLDLNEDPIVKLKLCLVEMTGYPDKDFSAKQANLTSIVNGLAKAAVLRMSAQLNKFPAFNPETSVVRRFQTVNALYNYTNTLNSLNIRVSEDTFLFGYSQYYTNHPGLDVVIRVVKGETVAAGELVYEQNSTILNEAGQRRELNQITDRTHPVIFQQPLKLEGGAWYTLSFTKPEGNHYLYYGSAPIAGGNGDRINFGDNKILTIKRAADDTIDNNHNIGQFSDLYLS